MVFFSLSKNTARVLFYLPRR